MFERRKSRILANVARSFSSRSGKYSSQSIDTTGIRLWVFTIGCGLIGLVLIARFFQLQVMEGAAYKVLASDQHTLQQALVPRRGTIYIRDRADNQLYPIAKDRDAWQVYAIPREMKDRAAVAEQVAQILNKPKEEFFSKLMSPTTTYLVLDRDTAYEKVEALRKAGLPGIGIEKGLARLYPEPGIGGQILGFVSLDDHNRRVGKYGLEGYFDELLSGKAGSIQAERDPQGRRLTTGSIQLSKAENGSDIVLTIDRQIQYETCKKAKEAMLRFEASGASIIIVDPQDGSLIAMCSVPDFDPTTYRKVDDIAHFNNPGIFYVYEPGSIFKAVTLAAGIDTGKITPDSTYTDTGEEKIDEYTIRNSDKKAHGLQTMTEVLEKSLNTGTIHVERLVGTETFRSYVKKFGFGEKTELQMSTEVKGDITNLNKRGEIFAATTSFGQGMSATPMQMVMSYVPLGNGGTRYKPRIIKEIISPSGQKEEKAPQSLGSVITNRTSKLISAMLVNVVENGHGKRAGVPGYYVAGKTGTAQIPDPRGGYLKDATIGSFVGYAPADDPKFVMLVKIDRPKTVEYAESSAAPIFGEMAKFLLSYMHVPTERKVKAVIVPPVVLNPEPAVLPLDKPLQP